MNHFTVSQATEELDMSRQGVWKAIKAGAIKAVRIGNVYAIPSNEISKARHNRLKTLRRRVAFLEAKENPGK